MVAMNEITEFAQRIGEEFKAHEVILFGSHAEDRAGRDSDVDLFIVMPFQGDEQNNPWKSKCDCALLFRLI